MKWEGSRESSNVEDRRGGGMGGGFPMGRAGGVGLGGIVVALVASLLFGVDPGVVLQGMGAGSPPAATAPDARSTPTDDMGRFVAVVLASTEEAWQQEFAERGLRYQAPALVLFEGATPTACGTGQAATGPFYCPADRRLYIDLSFYRVLRDRLGAPGDFAQAYVIAHEVGHHVQNLLGTMEQVQGMRGAQTPYQANQTSVRLELQADCYAGVWAARSQRARGWLEAGDIEEAIGAAAAVGDDRLKSGTVRPETFTHGSAEQRTRWFRTGLQAGDASGCDTFRSARL